MLYSISHSLPLAASTRCAAACASRPACPCRWRPASRSRSTSQTAAALPTAIRQTARPVIATASWTTAHRWRMQPGICCQAAAEEAAHPPASSTAAAPHASFRYFIATRRCRCATSFTFVVICWVSRVWVCALHCGTAVGGKSYRTHGKSFALLNWIYKSKTNSVEVSWLSRVSPGQKFTQPGIGHD